MAIVCLNDLVALALENGPQSVNQFAIVVHDQDQLLLGHVNLLHFPSTISCATMRHKDTVTRYGPFIIRCARLQLTTIPSSNPTDRFAMPTRTPPSMTGRFTVLASGSSGNAALLETDGYGLLIDCGLHPRMLSARLREIGVSWERINAVVLTHTHGDHWKEYTLSDLRSRKILYAHPDHSIT